jgi:Na+-transporting NADH:ubiquinone oxidoreductase subunit F
MLALSIGIAIVVFSALILALTAGLLTARKKLLPQGDVKISINGGEKIITTKPGASLLTALGSESIFLPSACGGGGTCAMCKCQVDAGGGDVLPTEMNHLSRKQAADNWRLACQVKVRGDMDIRVPAEKMGMYRQIQLQRSNLHQRVCGGIAPRRIHAL